MSRTVWWIAALLLAGCAGQKESQRQETPAADTQQGMEQEQPATTPEGEPQAMRGDMAGMCPAAVANTMVETTDMPQGVAMTFTTDPANVEELRRRVRMLAEMHEKGAMTMEGTGTGSPEGGDVRAGMEEESGMQQGGMQKGDMQGGMRSGDKSGMKKGHGAHAGMMGEMAMAPPASARVENVDRGARLVLTPENPADLEKLRTHAREHAQMMKSGDCPMMHHGGQG